MIYVVDIPDDGSPPAIRELDDPCGAAVEALAKGLSLSGYGTKLKVDPGVCGFLRRFLAAVPVIEEEETLLI